MTTNGTTNGDFDYSIHPPIANDKITLYVKTANPTNTANTLKPLILLEALQIPHHIHIIISTSNETWFHKINPYKMVPAMEDPLPSAQSVNLFDSSACLLYLAEKWDKEGVFSGKGDKERGAVMSWLMGYTAGLGATGKTWLMLLPKLPADSDALAILVGWIRKDYDVLEARLSEADQEWIALGDRPTIADFAIWPHANAKVAAMAKIEFGEWPRLKGWSERIAELGYVRKAVDRVGAFGHGGS